MGNLQTGPASASNRRCPMVSLNWQPHLSATPPWQPLIWQPSVWTTQGATLAEEGRPSNSLFLLVEGSAEISMGGRCTHTLAAQQVQHGWLPFMAVCWQNG